LKKTKSSKVKTSEKRTAVKAVKCQIRGQKVLQTRDEGGHIVDCFWRLTPKQEQAIKTMVNRRKKKRTEKRSRAKYNTRKLFGKMAKAHQKIADSLEKDRSQSAKRLYHEEIAATFAFLAKNGNGKEAQVNESLNRIPPMFKGALMMTMPEEIKRVSRGIKKPESNRMREY
jgi:hypothetical protein